MNENKFDNMGKLYAQFRPNYPQAFIEYLGSDIGLQPEQLVADIGAGTGILTRQLLESGYRVLAVEPNEDMRKQAEATLSGFSTYTSVVGTAENTTLPDKSVHLITAAQAFHWFDRQKFRTECQRILIPGGKVVLVWNSRDESSPLVAENDTINQVYCPNFKGFSGGMRGGRGEDDFNDFYHGDYECRVFTNNLIFDEQGFIGRNLSASYAPKEGDETYLPYIAALKVLFARYSMNGSVVMPNLTCSYAGEV